MEDCPLNSRRFTAQISRCLDGPSIQNSDELFDLEAWSIEILNLVQRTEQGKSKRGLKLERENSVIPSPNGVKHCKSVDIRMIA
jgi:hypothetical protein